jgi:membrane associated rhomboid family serine protease
MTVPVWVFIAIGGMSGSAVKAWATTSQATLSKASIIDVLIGGAVGAIFPLLGPSLLPDAVQTAWEAASTAQKAILMGILCYASSDFIQNMLSKLGITIPGGKVGAP